MRTTLGIIAPHPPIMVEAVGRDSSAVTAASSLALSEAHATLVQFRPHTLVVMSPHAPSARDAFLVNGADTFSGDLADFGAPDATHAAAGDPELAQAILAHSEVSGIPAVDLSSVAADAGNLDHGVVVPLSFLDPDGRWPLVVVSPSLLSLDTHWDLGAVIRQASDSVDRRVAFIASGDLSHRLTPDAPAGYSPRGANFDAEVVRLVATADLDSLRHLDFQLVAAAGECGLRSLVTLGGFLAGGDITSRVLHYEGPWGVGYLSAMAGTAEILSGTGDRSPETTADSGSKGGMPEDEESPHVALARKAIEVFLRTGRVIAATHDPPLQSSAAAFVSLHRGSALRGCIGTFEPSCDTLAEEIVAMAIQAATHDPRFPPMEIDELADLEISVDVLEPPEAIEGLDGLDPVRYGVIVSRDWRRGLLLPDLDGVDTAVQQVGIARRKAGIGPDEEVRLERFRVERFH